MGIQPTILPKPNPKGVGNIEIFKLGTAQWTEQMTGLNQQPKQMVILTYLKR
jgi:hypothetical protein